MSIAQSFLGDVKSIRFLASMGGVSVNNVQAKVLHRLRQHIDCTLSVGVYEGLTEAGVSRTRDRIGVASEQ